MNEEGNVELISKRIIDALQNNGSYEILFIDDGSTDNTLSTLKQLHKNNPKIKYISFSRNFGHQSALRAALDNAKGDCVVSLDGDLQHPPVLISGVPSDRRSAYPPISGRRTPRWSIGAPSDRRSAHPPIGGRRIRP
jgi:dolichol-phosphate mannosyltransferase